jgi:hypothetical protein
MAAPKVGGVGAAVWATAAVAQARAMAETRRVSDDFFMFVSSVSFGERR